MELNNNINTSVNDLSTLSTSVNVNSINGTEGVDANKNNSFTVDNQLNTQRSDLSSSLKDFISQISEGQENQITLENRSAILNDIKTITNDIINSENPEITADELQPTVQEHMEKYNSVSSNASANMDKFQEETDSTSYFDGKLGAKPLSPSDILDAVDEQMKVVTQQKEYNADKLQKIETKALDTIGDEISKSADEAPFEAVNFGKEIGNFSSANINNVVGSVALSQANAIPSHSPKLLA